jgi:hypothetical protein
MDEVLDMYRELASGADLDLAESEQAELIAGGGAIPGRGRAGRSAAARMAARLQQLAKAATTVPPSSAAPTGGGSGTGEGVALPPSRPAADVPPSAADDL